MSKWSFLTRIFLPLFCLCFAVAAYALDRSADQQIGQLISKMQLNADQVSIDVRQLNAQGASTPLLSWQADKSFNAASTVKVLTAAAALDLLGPSHRFTTRYWTDGTLKAGVLEGNLYIEGLGDPSMVSEQLWRTVLDLKSRGLSTIRGDIVGDDSYFASTGQKTAFESQMSSNNASGALSLNYNHIQVWVHPQQVGRPPMILMDPPLKQWVKLQNRAKTTSGSGNKLRLQVDASPKALTVKLSGEVGINSGKRQYYRPVSLPSDYFLATFKDFFERAGGKVTGRLRHAKLPKSAQLFYEKQSEAFLSQIVILLNKYSSNFIADQLVIAMGAHLGASGENAYARGIRYIEDFLRREGLSQNGTVLKSGSGLSRDNRLSAKQLAAVLQWATRQPQLGPELLASLSIFGEDGTTEKRPNAQDFDAFVRAKTGSLSGVAAITGLASSSDHQANILFALIVNQPGVSKATMEQFQNELIKIALKRAAVK